MRIFMFKDMSQVEFHIKIKGFCYKGRFYVNKFCCKREFYVEEFLLRSLPYRWSVSSDEQ